MIAHIQIKNYFFFFSGHRGSPNLSHSLSWSRQADVTSNGTMFAKIWTPEDPRILKISHTAYLKSQNANIRILRSNINRQFSRKNNDICE